MDFLKMANDIKDDLINWRRRFHETPELAFEEWKTSQVIKDFLKIEEVSYKEYARTGVAATIYGNGPKTVALRCDMDALPITDLKACDYSSKEICKMHACGHDAHMAMAMGAVKILNSIKDSLNGNVKFIFEPAEEDTGGAPIMINEGCLLNPDVDAMIGLHVSEGIETGKIGIKRDLVNVSSNPFKIIIEGKGGHGAYPQSTIDPIFIACQIVVAIQGIVTREIPPTAPTVITIGEIKGGSCGNVIPDSCTINGIIRTLRSEHREFIKKRLRELVEGIAESFRAKAILHIVDGYPALKNNNNITDIVISSAKKVIGKENIINLKNSFMGVESFAYFAEKVPSSFYLLGVKNEEKGIVHSAHSSLFDIDEDALVYGTAIHCETLCELLKVL